MRYKIKGQEKEKEVELEMTLSLEQSGNEVIVKGEETDGFIWRLLILCPDGTFRRCTGLAGDIGFQVTDAGEMVETKND